MEYWEKWIPIRGLPSTLYNDSLIDNSDGITLEFSDENEQNKIIVKFDGCVLSYRNTDEGSLGKIFKFLDKQYGTDFYANWTFFKVKNSEYINWFHEVSLGMYKSEPIEHYVFLTPDDVIEILSTDSPIIEIKK